MRSPVINEEREGNTVSSERIVSYIDSVLPGGHDGAFPEFQWPCPFCVDRIGDESGKKKLRVNVAKGKLVCYRCGYAAGDLAYFFKSLHNGHLLAVEQALLEDETPAVSSMCLRNHLMVKFFASGPEENAKLRPVWVPEETEWMEGSEDQVSMRLAWNYLRDERGLGDDASSIVERWNVGYCLTGDYANRLVIPVGLGGKPVYFTTRFCGDHKMKAKNPKNIPGRFHKENCLLGYDHCVGARTVVITEGFFSATPFEHAVALLGKTISAEQLSLLDRLREQGTEEFVLGVDPDASREAYELSRELSGRYPMVTGLELPDGKDPFDVRHDIPEIMKSRRPVDVCSVLRGLRPNIRRQFRVCRVTPGH